MNEAKPSEQILQLMSEMRDLEKRHHWSYSNSKTKTLYRFILIAGVALEAAVAEAEKLERDEQQ